MSVAFRNIDVDPASPVAEWGFEGLLAAIDRGDVREWHRIWAAVHDEPWGDVARLLDDEVLGAATDRGVVAMLRHAIVRERNRREAEERAEVAARFASLVKRSGLSQGDFADRIGTSRTRLNTYVTGKVTPSAAMLLRAERFVREMCPNAGSNR